MTLKPEHDIIVKSILRCEAVYKCKKFTNASETENLVYLDVDTNNTPDIAYYPHSNKVGIRVAGGIRDNFGLDSKVEYYDNE